MPQTQFKPIHFGNKDAQLLQACGYTHEFYPASWEDIGDCENGPKLSGHPDTHVWTLPGKTSSHEIVVVDGVVAEEGDVPNGPDELEM